MVAGNLVDHISKRFGSGDIWPKIRRLERDVTDTLNSLDIQGVSDYFNIPMSHLPTEERYLQLMERMKLLGFDQALESNIGEFVVRKAAKGLETGYGSFGLAREEFIGKGADEIAAKLAYIMPTFQVDDLADTAGRRVLSGSTITGEFLQDTARHMSDPSALMQGTRMVFDVESAGLDPSQKIWQLSARLMNGDTELETVNLRFKNSNMDRGLYMSQGQNMTFQQFYDSMVGGKVDWLDFDDGIQDFLKMSKKADVFVGQNAAFDVRMLDFGLKDSRLYGVDEGFTRLADEFLSSATTGGKLVDTRLFSAAIFSKDISIADELQRIDKFTPFSLENILLETSFLEDLSKRVGWDEINARIGQGLHYGDVDTWFEDHLFRMQSEVLSGRGEGLLQVARLGDETLRASISAASAITPFTKVSELGGLTPIQHLAQQTRVLDAPMFDGKLLQNAMESQLFEAGIFSNWTDSLLTEGGKVRWGQTLTDPIFAHIEGLPGHTGGATIQARAIEAGLPFGGISSFERMISTIIGRTTSGGMPAGLDTAREWLGELTGSGMVRGARKVRVYGGKNVAIPMEILQAAEQSFDVATRKPIITSQFHQALGEEGVDAVQYGRWSAISWQDRRTGRIHRDVALVADIFDNEVQVDNLVKFLRENQATYSISEEVMQSVELAAREGSMQRYGVQVGTMQGKGSSSVRLLAEFMEEHGFGIDRGAADLVTPVFGPSGAMRQMSETVSDWIFTGATMVTGKDGALPEGDVLANVRGTSMLNDLIMGSRDDVSIRAGAEWAKSRSDAAAGRNVHMLLERNLPKMKGRAAVAAGAIAGYYLFKGKKEQDRYDETMGTIGYEDAGFYEDYKSQLGEMALSNYRQQHMDALATAGTVGRLDRNKLGHHAMGPNKHAHLYGG